MPTGLTSDVQIVEDSSRSRMHAAIARLINCVTAIGLADSKFQACRKVGSYTTSVAPVNATFMILL
jgi:hypothetical protein